MKVAGSLKKVRGAMGERGDESVLQMERGERIAARTWCGALIWHQGEGCGFVREFVGFAGLVWLVGFDGPVVGLG